MALDWALQMFGAAGDLHVAMLSAAMFATLWMAALKVDSGEPNPTWWTVFSPCIASTVTSIYIYVLTGARLRRMVSAVLLLCPTILMVLLMATFVLMARLLEEGDISAAVACVPLDMIFFLAMAFPDRSAT
mmetsp:Transcript_20930/g.54422  ORF Transcript_20930/g.54422 Transcript_20930/m.54422 type:complete len:131 (-) Transcript_20930:238-630(-)